MELVRWSTPISDCNSLYFRTLVDDGEGCFVLESDTGDLYEVVLGGQCGPYVISSEEFLTKYWSVKSESVGWTFIVEHSDLINLFPGVMDSGNYKHYVVSTMDTCLEILSERAPIIRGAPK